MAEPLEGKFVIDGLDEGIRDLKRLVGETREAGDAAKGAGSGWGTLSDKITAGVVSVRAAYDAISALVTKAAEAAKEFERQSAVINRFSGDISNASRRVNGLISDIDLMIQQNKASRAGLELTAEQFGTLAVRASEWAAATGKDATEAFDRLMQSVATGEEGPLKELGVNLQGLTTIQERQEVALRELTTGYEDATSEADSLAGKLLTLGTRLDNAETEMIGAIEQSGLLDEAFDNLGGATRDLIGEFSLFGDASVGPLSDIEVFTITGAAMLTAFTERVEASVTILRKLGDAGRALRESRFGDIGDALSGIQEDITRAGGFDADQRIEDLTMQGLNRAASEKGKADGSSGGGGPPPPGGGGGNDRDVGMGPGESISAYEFQVELAEALNERRERQMEIERELAENEQLKAEAAAEALAMAKTRQRLAEEELEANRLLKEEVADRAEVEAKANAKREKSAKTQQRIQRGAEEFAGLIQNTLELAAEGQENLGKSFVTMIDEWLKQFAIQEAYKGAAAFAEGIGNAVMNTGHAAAKFAEAAQHFALAAVAGGASAAIPNQGGGGGASGGAGAGSASADQGGGGDGGGTVVVNVNAPVSEQYLGRMTARSQREAERRFR
jgi:hypothetical protein